MGPYLRTADGQLPVDPFTSAVDWQYATNTAEVHSKCSLKAMDGTNYDSW